MTAVNATAAGTTIVFEVSGMTCDSCARRVGEALGAVAGVSEVEVSRRDRRARVVWAAGTPDVDGLVDAVRVAGYDAQVRQMAGSPGDVPGRGAECACCRVPA